VPLEMNIHDILGVMTEYFIT